MIPLYLAAAATLPTRRHLRIAALVAAPLLFFALGVIRTLLVALPPTLVSSSLMSVHGFYQILVGGAVIAMTAIAAGRPSGRPEAVRVGAACGSAVLASLALGHIWTATIVSLAKLTPTLAPHSLTTLSAPGDVQGALAVLPTYQLGLLVGLWVASRQRLRSGRFATALIVLGIAQVATLAALGEARFHSGLDAHAVITRGWAVVLPLLLALLFVARPRAEERLDRASYRDFWQKVGSDFPDLAGARSTELYFQNEVSLLSTHIPMLDGCRLLKTDLWDEAKNTRILQWAARRGAIVHGIDLSAPIVTQARAAFDGLTLKASHADVRHLPFTDNSFDVIYSMGTVEHFAESDAAVRECARVLKPGGRLILGVPNRHDPFLRPLLVAVLNTLGLYGYGFEKSYSRGELRRMMEASGLEVVAESGILFIPGWLRMLDLACHVRRSRVAGAVRAAVSIFVWLDRRAPGLRRYGYLLASVGIKVRP